MGVNAKGEALVAPREYGIMAPEAIMHRERLNFIKNLAIEAGRLTLQGYGNCGQVPKDARDGYDIATEYDVRTEDLVKNMIVREFGEPVLGDGTFNYQRGLPLYGVSIAYCEDAIPVCGAIFLPALRQLFFAARDQGAFLAEPESFSPSPIHVGHETEMTRLIIAVAGSDMYRLVAACADQGFPRRSLRFFMCAVLSLAYIASGRMDAYCHSSLSLWDCAAGDILLREAGGPGTMDYAGTPVFPEYLERRIVLNDTSGFPFIAASSRDLVREPINRLLSAAGLIPQAS
jgi:fructose-1,6-bisphosphatase/inositol monophosphatase family enzyme